MASSEILWNNIVLCGVNLESDPEIGMSRIGGDFLDSGISDVAGKIFLNLLYATVNVFRGALGEHLDGAVHEVADVTGELMATGHAVRGKAKTDTLDPADEDYVSGNHFLTTH